MRFLALISAAILISLIPVHAFAQNGSAGGAPGVSGMDIDQAVQTEMMENSRDSHQELKDQMKEVDDQNKKKKAQRDALNKMKERRAALKKDAGKNDLTTKKDALGDKKDNLGDMSAQDSLEIQQYHDRHEKATSTLSNTMRKFDDTQNTLTNNLK